MLLEEYPYANRAEDTIRIEDDYPYGFELYRANVTGTYLVPLCIGAYGFANETETRIEAKNRAHKFMLQDRQYGSANKVFSVYAKIYKMDRSRNVIKESIRTTEPLFEGEIRMTNECLENGTVETV